MPRAVTRSASRVTPGVNGPLNVGGGLFGTQPNGVPRQIENGSLSTIEPAAIVSVDLLVEAGNEASALATFRLYLKDENIDRINLLIKGAVSFDGIEGNSTQGAVIPEGQYKEVCIVDADASGLNGITYNAAAARAALKVSHNAGLKLVNDVAFGIVGAAPAVSPAFALIGVANDETSTVQVQLGENGSFDFSGPAGIVLGLIGLNSQVTTLVNGRATVSGADGACGVLGNGFITNTGTFDYGLVIKNRGATLTSSERRAATAQLLENINLEMAGAGGDVTIRAADYINMVTFSNAKTAGAQFVQSDGSIGDLSLSGTRATNVIGLDIEKLLSIIAAAAVQSQTINADLIGHANLQNTVPASLITTTFDVATPSNPLMQIENIGTGEGIAPVFTPNVNCCCANVNGDTTISASAAFGTFLNNGTRTGTALTGVIATGNVITGPAAAADAGAATFNTGATVAGNAAMFKA